MHYMMNFIFLIVPKCLTRNVPQTVLLIFMDFIEIMEQSKLKHRLKSGSIERPSHSSVGPTHAGPEIYSRA